MPKNNVSARCSGAGFGVAALMASTMLTGAPALAQQQAASAKGATDVGEVIVTAQKRSENIQKVPMSIQAIDSKKLDQLNITGFADYVKFMPSVSFQTEAPNQTSIYMRGVASGDNANHSGPLPSVGSYLDEQPITTIGGTLDIHVYDIARVEVLPGPQGTLYGASSQAGTMRIITNKPSTSGFFGGVDIQANDIDHGSQGYVFEGFVNIPLSDKVAVRLVGYDEHDGGYINNTPGTLIYPTSGGVDNNAAYLKNHFNEVDEWGGRAALKWNINDNWSLLTSVIGQETEAPGVFGYEPSIGYLDVNRYQADTDHDRWYQAAATLTGKIGKYDLTYSSGYFARAVDSQSDYTDYSIAYDHAYGSGAFWQDGNGNPISIPSQEIIGKDRFTKQSNELRIASPSSDRLRFTAGLFQEAQYHWIVQDYQIQGFGSQLAVPGWANTIWLTDQNRVDRDEAAFGEVYYDITPKLTVTGGIRGYHYKNTLYGFYGFSAAYDELTGFSTGMGADSANCKTGQSFNTAPCVNLNKTVTGSGETHKINLTYKFDGDHLIYFTYSTGYRPGGVNRSGDFGPYQSDTLDNYEIGWKTSWLDHSVHFNGAVYDEEWNKFQFSFLGPNSLTIVENAPSARIRGIETSADIRSTDHMTFSGGASYNDAKLTANFCGTDQSTGTLIASCSADTAQAVKGQQLPYTPKFKGNLTARYAWELGDWNAHLQGSALVQTRNFAALRTADIANLGIMPGYATFDFSAGVDRNKTSIELFIKNAFDRHGEINRYTPCTTAICSVPYGSGATGAPAAVYVVPIQPLTVGIKFGQKF